MIFPLAAAVEGGVLDEVVGAGNGGELWAGELVLRLVEPLDELTRRRGALERRSVRRARDEALEAAIAGLLDDPERARALVAAGLSQIAARFSVEAMVEATERVLAETVPGSAA